MNAPTCLLAYSRSLQVALSSSQKPQHLVDVNSSLFLNLNSLRPSDLALRGGRIAFRHSGEVPCVLHANGFKGILSKLTPRVRERVTWLVQRRMQPHHVQTDWYGDAFKLVTLPER